MENNLNNIINSVLSTGCGAVGWTGGVDGIGRHFSFVGVVIGFNFIDNIIEINIDQH